MRGIRRKHGVSQLQAKPLLRDALFEVVSRMGERRNDVRNKALSLSGFANGFRWSELCALDREDPRTIRQGLVIAIRQLKLGQESA